MVLLLEFPCDVVVASGMNARNPTELPVEPLIVMDGAIAELAVYVAAQTWDVTPYLRRPMRAEAWSAATTVAHPVVLDEDGVLKETVEPELSSTAAMPTIKTPPVVGERVDPIANVEADEEPNFAVLYEPEADAGVAMNVMTVGATQSAPAASAPPLSNERLSIEPWLDCSRGIREPMTSPASFRPRPPTGNVEDSANKWTVCIRVDKSTRILVPGPAFGENKQ